MNNSDAPEMQQSEEEEPKREQKRMRSQMLCELHRVKKEMIDNSGLVSKTEVWVSFLEVFLQFTIFFLGGGGILWFTKPNPWKDFIVIFKNFFFRKPYTPDVFNDLAPYYNTYIVNYMIDDQVGK